MFKTIKILIIFFFVFLIAFFYFKKGESIPEEEKFIWIISSQTAQQFQNKYNLHLSSVGLSGDKKLLKNVKLTFFLNRTLSKDDGRKLILKCIKEFLENINNSEYILPYLSNLPFTEKNIELTILLYKDEQHTKTVDPDICCIAFRNNKIYYYTNNPANTNLYKNEEEENFNEAIKINQLRLNRNSQTDRARST